MMRNWRLLAALGSLALSGCVIGSGPCLWLQVRHTFTGQLHFREFPSKDGIDTAGILALDKTTYVYAPAQSFQCLAANDVQLIDVAEFPRNVGEGTRVRVEGKVLVGVADRDHTRFVVSVLEISPAPVKP